MLGQNLLDLSPSLSGKVFTCWDRTPLIDKLCWITTAPARVVLCNFRSTTMRPCSCSFLAMAAPVRHNNLKLGISEFRCVASPAPARAFVPARLSSVFGCLTRVARTSLFSDPITRSFIGGRVNHAQNLIPSALVEPTLAWKALRNPLFRLYSGQR